MRIRTHCLPMVGHYADGYGGYPVKDYPSPHHLTREKYAALERHIRENGVLTPVQVRLLAGVR